MDSIRLTIRKKVREHIFHELITNTNKISDESLIFREGFIDSMGFIMMLTFIDETFGIKVNDEDLVEENFESINAITEFIFRKAHK